MPDTDETTTPNPGGRHRAQDQPAPGPAPAPAPAYTERDWRKLAVLNMSRLAQLLADTSGRPLPELAGVFRFTDDSTAWRQAVAANLASLNELAAEITAAVSGDPAFVEFVAGLLRDHSWSLGFQFMGERAPGDWLPPWQRPANGQEAE